MVVRLTLVWRCLREIETPYTVFTHLLDGAGQVRGQKDSPPQGGRYPTTLWAPGEIVLDAYEIVVEERLYEAYAEEILEVIEEQDDWVDHLMVIGHNPGLTALANHLSSLDIENVPTCGVVELRYDIETWAVIGEAAAVEVDFDYPKKRVG